MRRESLLLVGVMAGLASTLPAQDTDRGSVQLMKELSEQLRCAERGLDDGDLDEVVRCVRRLSSSSAAATDIEPQHDVQHRDETSLWVEALRSEAEAILALQDRPEPELYGEHLDGIRRACVSCHLQFRSDNAERGLFPSRGNTVYGRIRVVKVDGEERRDRSNVVAFLDQVPGQWPPPSRRPSVSQRDRVFDPPILVVSRGTTVDFPNDDLVFHNVFSLSKAKPFDLDLYAAGHSKSVTFDRPGLVKVYCNIHPEMVAHVLVLANPFATKTTPSGFFAIPDIPDGSFRFRVWHEFGGESEEQLELAEGQAVRVDVRLRETRKRVSHRNKHGKRYGGKYQ